jgi:hypothetical protein
VCVPTIPVDMVEERKGNVGLIGSERFDGQIAGIFLAMGEP